MRMWGLATEYTAHYMPNHLQHGRLVTPEHVQIHISGLTWQIFDQTAYGSSTGILTRAGKLSVTTFDE